MRTDLHIICVHSAPSTEPDDNQRANFARWLQHLIEVNKDKAPVNFSAFVVVVGGSPV